MKTTFHLVRMTRAGNLSAPQTCPGFDSVEALTQHVSAHPPRFVVNGQSKLVIVAVVGEVEVSTSINVLDEATLRKHGLAPAEKI